MRSSADVEYEAVPVYAADAKDRKATAGPKPEQFSVQHSIVALPPAIRMAAKKDSRCAALAHSRDRVAQAGAIAAPAWRGNGGPVRRLLAKGKIAAQDGVAMSGKSFAERHQQWEVQSEPAPCVRIRASPLGFAASAESRERRDQVNGRGIQRVGCSWRAAGCRLHN